MDPKKSDLVVLSKLKRINVTGGDVLHCLRANEKSFEKFGEAYFSFIEMNHVKAWKRHLKMKMNLIVPVGKVRFVFYSPEKIFYI